jgi:hypothetical protein
VLLLRAAAAPTRDSHALAACVHLLLGGANVLFWNDAFVQVHLETVGVVTTALHALFLGVQGAYAQRTAIPPIPHADQPAVHSTRMAPAHKESVRP